MTHPTGKGIFIWQASKYYIPDPVAEVVRIKAAGFKWAAVQTVDGYMTQWPTNIVPIINALRAERIKVWTWGMIYANGPNAEGWGYSEGVIAAHHRRTLLVQGHIFDPEAHSKRSGGALGVSSAYIGYAEEDWHDHWGMTTYRYPELHPTFPWKEALDGVRFVMPQVYWEGAHNPGYQLRRSFDQYRKLTQVPYLPIGSAYGVTGWEPTPADLRDFHRTVVELELPGYSFWNWEKLSRRPSLLAAVTAMG